MADPMNWLLAILIFVIFILLGVLEERYEKRQHRRPKD